MPEPWSPLTTVLRRNLQQALREHRADQARHLLERLKELAPLDVVTRGSELEVLLVEGRLDEAHGLVRGLLEQFPTSARIHFLAGQLAYRRRDYPRAVELLEEAERLTASSRTRHWLGKALTQAGRLEEAEAILVPLAEGYPAARADLAWLYERMERPGRAIEILDAILKDTPGDPWAEAQRRRLRVKELPPEQIVEEIDALRELGEEVPEALLPDYLDGLLAQAQLERAREIVLRGEASWPGRTVLGVAWVCHKRLCPDLACRLFLRLLPEQTGNAKLLAALESDALKAGRGEELAELYRSLAAQNPHLFGRLRNLGKRLAQLALELQKRR